MIRMFKSLAKLVIVVLYEIIKLMLVLILVPVLVVVIIMETFCRWWDSRHKRKY